MSEDIYKRNFDRPFPRHNILVELSVMEKLNQLWVLPTVKQVYQGFNWRYHDLKQGKGNNYKPPLKDVISLLEADVKKSWAFASLGENVISSRQFYRLVTELHSTITKLKKQNKDELNSHAYLAKLENLW